MDISDVLYSLRFALRIKSILGYVYVWAAYLLISFLITIGSILLLGINNIVGAIFSVVSIILILIALFLMGSATEIAILREAYSKKSFLDEFKGSGDVILILLVYNLVVGVLTILLNIIFRQRPLGFILNLFTSIFIGLSLLISPAYIVIKKQGIIESMKRSYEAFKQKPIDFVVYYLIMALATMAFLIMIMLMAVFYLFVIASIIGIQFGAEILNSAEITHLLASNIVSVMFLTLLCGLLVVIGLIIMNRFSKALLIRLFEMFKRVY